ncbi:MAG: SMC family ATPase [Dehalococcoidia bacterium]|jgi:exonuclease SbcC
MIPIKLSLRNFMCYREASLSFDGIHVACLCGDNGNGKSALLDAMTWALWGKSRAKTDDELIHLGMTDMEVEFEFAVGRERYRVIRKRSKAKSRRAGQSVLDFQVAASDGFRSISGNAIRETEHKIIDTLRMDYDTFINSAYLVQGRADEFSKKEPGKRKQVLADILGLSRYDELESRAREQARLKEREARDTEIAITQMDSEVAEKGTYEAGLRSASDYVAQMEKEWQKLQDAVRVLQERKQSLDLKQKQQTDIEKRIKQAQSAISSFDARVQEHRKRIEKYESLVAAYADVSAKVKSHIEELALQEDDLEKKRAQFQEMSNRAHSLTTENAKLKEEMEDLRKKVDMLSSGEAECPLCGTELGVGGRTKIMENYEKQGVEKKELFRVNEGERNRIEAVAKSLKTEISSIDRAVREGRELWARRAESLDRDYKEAQKSLPDECDALKKAEGEMQQWLETLDAEVKDLESQKAELVGMPEVEAKLAAAKKELNDVARGLEQGRQQMGSVKEKIDRCANLERTRAEKSALKEAVIKELKIYEELALAFGKKGIQAMLIENALPELEEEANSLLSRMTDNRMSVKIESQRALKSKEGEAETLDINIGDELGTRRYEMYSGGEAFRIDFALRIALSKLLARRAGAPLPTLIIDEGFGSQDASGRERLVEAINSIQDDFEKILVITHIDEMKEYFPMRIEVTKGSDGSKVQVI